MDNLLPALIAITPPILTGILFYLVYRAITRADRNERRALAELEREHEEHLARTAETTNSQVASSDKKYTKN